MKSSLDNSLSLFVCRYLFGRYKKRCNGSRAERRDLLDSRRQQINCCYQFIVYGLIILLKINAHKLMFICVLTRDGERDDGPTPN